ncbi:unnamed protein product [Rotaria sp. Silwood2]|nr:unnamed protein product [Rotaria sp. Silwood2]CAF4604749.1 unnamed protein product [Rotaria sp. Silwood2]
MDPYDDMNRVLITNDVDSQCVDMLIANGFSELDILIVRIATKVTNAVIKASPRLKLIGRVGTGADSIDTEAATRHGILVMKFVIINNLINDEVLSLCKRGVKLINVARSGIIDEKALLNALNSGQSSPHLGVSTREAQKRVAIDLAQQITDFKQEHSLIGVVNGSAITSQFAQGENEIKELSGIVSGDHLWLNIVNQYHFIAHVPLDDDNVHVLVRPIKRSFMDYLRDNTSQINNRISAVFNTVTPTGKIQDQRRCTLLL